MSGESLPEHPPEHAPEHPPKVAEEETVTSRLYVGASFGSFADLDGALTDLARGQNFRLVRQHWKASDDKDLVRGRYCCSGANVKQTKAERAANKPTCPFSIPFTYVRADRSHAIKKETVIKGQTYQFSLDHGHPMIGLTWTRSAIGELCSTKTHAQHLTEAELAVIRMHCGTHIPVHKVMVSLLRDI
jgi:hypothetical protein